MRTEDGYIVNKCLNGDSAAFGFLVDKYKESVYAFAYSRLHDFHDAEDVTQEVFIRAYQKLRTLRRCDRFLAWLYAITANLSRNWLRAKSRRPDRYFIEDENPQEPVTDSPSDEPVIDTLQDALDSLPEAYRQVLTLRYLGGMNSREIAEFLGTSPTAIRQRLTRARSQLKEGMPALIGASLGKKKLHTGFTFRIVEKVKQARILPMPRIMSLPWGFSSTVGIILILLILNPQVAFFNRTPKTPEDLYPDYGKVLKAQEMPAEIVKPSGPLSVSGKHGPGAGRGEGSAEKGEDVIARFTSRDKKDDIFWIPQMGKDQDAKGVISGSLVAYWPMDGDAKDATGNGGDGRISGDPQFVNGRFGGAIMLDGRDDCVVVPDDRDQSKFLDLTSGITLMAWVRPESASSSNSYFVAKPRAYSIGCVKTALSRMTLCHSVYTAALHGPKSCACAETGIWTHVAMTCDGEKMIYYMDGKETDRFDDISGPINVTDSNLVIGAGQSSDDKALRGFFHGAFDEVAIFNVALKPDAIELLMNTGVREIVP